MTIPIQPGGSVAGANREPAGSAIPLCVDLDGTLIRTDLLWESVVLLARRRPLAMMLLPFWLARGKAHLKEKLARAVRIDAATLPYNEALVEHLRRERASGRRLLLVTASHARPAQDVANHVGLFDEVLATEDGRNLSGARKREELVRRFGERGFDYAGNSAADLAVWPAAREALAVDASRAVLRRLGRRANGMIESPRRPLPLALASAIRARQWVKNLLVFVPILLAHRYFDGTHLAGAALGFVAFSLGASGVYVLNDMLDVEADRLHPEKRRRPFASGELPLGAGLALIPLLAGASLGAALVLPPAFGIILGVYFAATTLYSFLLKQFALVDVLMLAGLFTLRIMAGAAASGVDASEWLLAFSMFIFLSLAAVKRFAELQRMVAAGEVASKVARRGYFAADHLLILQMGICSGFMSVLVLALYITSDGVSRLYSRPELLWLACPLLLYWIGRIWLLAHRGEVHDDPLNFAVRDWNTWIVALAGTAVMVAASGAG